MVLAGNSRRRHSRILHRVLRLGDGFVVRLLVHFHAASGVNVLLAPVRLDWVVCDFMVNLGNHARGQSARDNLGDEVETVCGIFEIVPVKQSKAVANAAQEQAAIVKTNEAIVASVRFDLPRVHHRRSRRGHVEAITEEGLQTVAKLRTVFLTQVTCLPTRVAVIVPLTALITIGLVFQNSVSKKVSCRARTKTSQKTPARVVARSLKHPSFPFVWKFIARISGNGVARTAVVVIVLAWSAKE